MSQLHSTLQEDMKNAMRARDAVRLGVIRFALSLIKNAEIDGGVQSDAQITAILSKEVKKMTEAIEQFALAGRDELVEEEKVKVKILASYLPAQMSEEELKKIVITVCEKMPGAQMGQIIGAVLKEAQGKADGGMVSKLVKAQLA
ncbi:MAG: GatB/YqeY domain-containing protein [Microgenomates group bacterium]